MCEIVCVKKIILHSPGLLQVSFFHDEEDRGGFPVIVTLCRELRVAVLNDSQKTESFTLASAIQPGALVGEFFLCVFIEVCIECAQKL